MQTTVWPFAFALLVLVIPATLAFFLHRDIRRSERRGKVVASGALFLFNIVLFYFCYAVVAFTWRGPTRDATVTNYKLLLVVQCLTVIGVLVSLATVALGFFLERSLARKLSMWGSAAGIAIWPLLYLATSEYIAQFRLAH